VLSICRLATFDVGHRRTEPTCCAAVGKDPPVSSYKVKSPVERRRLHAYHRTVDSRHRSRRPGGGGGGDSDTANRSNVTDCRSFSQSSDFMRSYIALAVSLVIYTIQAYMACSYLSVNHFTCDMFSRLSPHRVETVQLKLTAPRNEIVIMLSLDYYLQLWCLTNVM